jgi:hypothetical protein
MLKHSLLSRPRSRVAVALALAVAAAALPVSASGSVGKSDGHSVSVHGKSSVTPAGGVQRGGGRKIR